jgi:hypothetical protein
VWQGGTAEWLPASQIPELFDFQSSIPPPLPASGAGAGRVTAGASAEFDDEGAAPAANTKLRMVDWLRALKLGLIYFPIAAACSGIVFFLIFSFGSHGHPEQHSRAIAVGLVVALVGVLLGLVAIVVNLFGHVFDPARDRLTYPTYIFRRTIPISNITDANCETLIGHNPLGAAIVNLIFQRGSYGSGKPLMEGPPRGFMSSTCPETLASGK